MNRIRQAKFALRHEFMGYDETHGLHAAARRYDCLPSTCGSGAGGGKPDLS